LPTITPIGPLSRVTTRRRVAPMVRKMFVRLA